MIVALHPPVVQPHRRHLRLVAPDEVVELQVEPGAHRRPASVYRRRRAVAGLAVAGIALASRLTIEQARSGETPSTGLPAPAATTTSPVREHVVQPGDTLWALARRAQPDGDIRPLVARLSKARGSRPLHVGERISLPAA